ncbi:MAG: hypothetical protein IT445_09830 [Phycisphaeraceae bacterium]|nr:hypothetical protein [Phycisphaeraceae bacterium]
MFGWFRQLDEILRGDATRLSRLQEGQVRIPVFGLSVVTIFLAAVYGVCMASFTVFRTGGSHEALMQLLASAIKLPLLFFLTLLVTLPSLYVFNALVGSRLTLRSVVRLLVAMIAVMIAVLASLGPIVVFFGVSTDSYWFMKLLNVAMSAIAGVLGLTFLLRTLHRLVVVRETFLPRVASEADEQDPDEPSGALDDEGLPTDARAKTVFNIWVIVFALVGAQMSWVLRPFIGHPGAPFEWLRDKQSNFFTDLIDTLGKLFGGS